jgi:hypothetical protein
MKLAFDLPQAQAEKLRDEAKRLGLAPEELARAALANLLGTPDTEFRAAATRVLHKNEELYKRLA